MLETARLYVSGFVEKIFDNGTLAIKAYFYRECVSENQLDPLSQCFVNHLGEKFDFFATAIHEEIPVYQMSENYGIGNAIGYVVDAAGKEVGNAVRYVAGETIGNVVVDTVADQFKHIMSHKTECFFIFLGTIAFCELTSRLTNNIYQRLNEPPHLAQVNNTPVVQANNPPVLTEAPREKRRCARPG